VAKKKSVSKRKTSAGTRGSTRASKKSGQRKQSAGSARGAKSRSTSGRSTKKASVSKKKSASKKTKTSKKPSATKKGSPAKKPSKKKKTTTRKSTTKKKPTKKSAAKKSTKKKTGGAATKKTSKRSSASATTKKSTKKPSGKTTSRKKADRAKSEPSTTDRKQSETGATQKAGEPGKTSSGRQGMTVVSKRRPRSERPKPEAYRSGAGHSRMKGRKPLIPSGPTAQAAAAEASDADAEPRSTKTPFNKRQLDRFRNILLQKRAELVGEVSDLEEGALRGTSGSLSHVSQHMADQGSDAADQSLSLDLAAAERRLVKDIDDAIERIDNKTYGICEVTGQPIAVERLEELPWTRYSIVAARELERRSLHE